MIAENSPTIGWTYYEWDNEDNLTQVTNELAQTIAIKHDSFGRIIKIITNDDSAKVKWGEYNQKESVIGPDYQLHYAYDQLGNISKKTWQFTDQSFTANYKYNNNRQLTTVDYPSGLSLNYEYNEDGQLDQIAQKSWIKNKVLVSNISDDNPYDNQSIFDFGNGISQTQAYRDNEIVEWAGNKDIAYSYSTPFKGGYAIDYAYPSVSNDDSASTDSTSQNNQGTQKSNNTAPTEPSKAVAQTTTTADQYNSIGQLLQESGREYRYDSLGRLTQVTENENSKVTYDYLITGERYKKSVLDSSQANEAKQTTYYLYDNGILISELTQTATNNKPQFTDYVYHNNRPLLQFNQEKPFYLTTDHRGAVMAVTDDNKDIVWQAYLTDNGQATVFNGSQITMNIRGSNQYYDAETALHYNIHRYFSPTRNQYLTPDPVGLAAGEDLYAFANDRPHEFVDLWGLAPEPYEAAPGHDKVPSPTAFGTYVHSYFGAQVLLKNSINLDFSSARDEKPWGQGGSRSKTWPTGVGKRGKGALKPDAWYVSPSELEKEKNDQDFKGSIWELKPATYKKGYRYQNAKDQVKRYIKQAKRGSWQAGGCYSLKMPASNLLTWKGNVYNVSFQNDILPKVPTGLIFYSAKKVKKNNETSKETAAEALLKSSTIADTIAQIKKMAKDIGWQELAIAGIAILVIAAIIAVIVAGVGPGVVIGAVLTAISFALRYIVAMVVAGALTLTAAVADVFGFNSDTVKSDAENEGKKQDKGILGKLYDKFKGWF